MLRLLLLLWNFQTQFSQPVWATTKQGKEHIRAKFGQIQPPTKLKPKGNDACKQKQDA